MLWTGIKENDRSQPDTLSNGCRDAYEIKIMQMNRLMMLLDRRAV